MSGKRKTCKICKHKKIVQINKALSTGESVSKIAQLYGFSRNTVAAHRNECIGTVIVQTEEVKEVLLGDVLLRQVQDQIELVQKMIIACDEWLTDPDNPDKYFIGPRGDEIELVYNEVDENTGRLLPQKQKATIQEMVQTVESGGRYVVRGISNKHADPRDLLLKAIGKLEGTIKMINESTRKLIEWEHQKKALEKANKEGGVISIEKQIDTITERVTIAFKGSNSEELCQKAGLPELR